MTKPAAHWPRLIEPLASWQFWAHVGLGALGAVLLVGTSLRSIVDVWQVLGQGIGTSCVAAALVTLVPECVRRAYERKFTRRAQRFFGRRAFQNGMQLVFAERRVEDIDFLKHLYAPGAPEKDGTVTIRNPSTHTMEALPKGVRSWAAEQDIRAASYLTGMAGSLGLGVEIKLDMSLSPAKPFEYPLIAIGLGFNGCTVGLSRLDIRCDGEVTGRGLSKSKTRTPPLFEVKWVADPLARGELSDQLVVGGSPLTPTDDENDYALVARLVAGDGDVVHFVCAGSTAAGTACAGHF